MSDKWIFFSNMENKMKTHFEMALQASQAKGIEIIDIAYDNTGSLLKDHFAIYINEDYRNTGEMQKCFECENELENVYRNMLLSAGIIDQEFADSHYCYLGIEKEYNLDISSLTTK